MMRISGPDDGPTPWADLLNRIILWLNAPPQQSVHWIERWQFYEQNPYYLARVNDRSRNCLAAHGRSYDWLDCMQMEVRELFGHELSKDPDLGIDPARIQETFPAYFDAVITHLCSKAYANLCRQHARRCAKGLPPPRPATAADPAEQLDQCRDVNWALDQLGEPCASRLRLYGSHTVQEMAEAYGVSYPTVQCQVDRCLAKLRRILKDYEIDQEDR